MPDITELSKQIILKELHYKNVENVVMETIIEIP